MSESTPKLPVAGIAVTPALLSHMRHELCTPINAILGYSEMLIEDAEGGRPDALDDLRQVHDEGQRLLTLTSSILDTARFQSQVLLGRDCLATEIQERMRPPIQAVLGGCARLIAGAGGVQSEYVRDLQKIYTSGELLLELINDIERLSTIEARPHAGESDRGSDGGLRTMATAVVDVHTQHAEVEAPHQASLLVVDDNELNREMLSRRLERLGFSVTLADDGYRALELMQTQRFDLVLLDIRMPGIDGMEVLTRLRQSFSMKDLPVIMATADNRSEEIVQALASGANDYVTKPFDFPVVVARVHTQLSLKRAIEALASAHVRMKADLEAAARVQLALLPTELPSGDAVQFAWSYQPCDELAGDILGIQRLDAQHVGLYVLDVSGHGVRAALLAVTVNRLLSHTTEGSIVLKSSSSDGKPAPVSPALVAEHLNKRFPVDSNGGHYFTLFYGVLNVATLELVYVVAGHAAPLHLRRGEVTAVATTDNVPIGLLADARFEESRVVLKSRDRLYICSDGVLEAGERDDPANDGTWLISHVRQLQAVPLKESADALTRTATERDQGRLRDDVSIVAVEID